MKSVDNLYYSILIGKLIVWEFVFYNYYRYYSLDTIFWFEAELTNYLSTILPI